jgi:hypothetical protein
MHRPIEMNHASLRGRHESSQTFQLEARGVTLHGVSDAIPSIESPLLVQIWIELPVPQQTTLYGDRTFVALKRDRIEIIAGDDFTHKLHHRDRRQFIVIKP